MRDFGWARPGEYGNWGENNEEKRWDSISQRRANYKYVAELNRLP